MAEPGGGNQDCGEPDEGELGDEKVSGIVMELPEGRWEGEEGYSHDVEQQGEAGGVPQESGPFWQSIAAGEPGDGERGEASKDVPIPAMPRHLHGNEAGEEAEVEEDLDGDSKGLIADQPGERNFLAQGECDGGDGADGNQDAEREYALKITEGLAVGEGAGYRPRRA